MKSLSFGFGVLLLMAAHAGMAQPEYAGAPRFESVGVGKIPRDVVPTFVQDKAGYFWIATGDGLTRFDGYYFRPQALQSADPAKRNLGWIRALLAGNDGNVWIGTETKGLAVYEASVDKVRLLSAQTAGALPLAPRPTIRALAQDGAGRIYAGSIGGGIEVFDPRSAAHSSLRQTGHAGDLPDNRVQALLFDRKDGLWAGTWAGLSVRRSPGAGFERIDLPGSREAKQVVQALAQASDGRIWVGTQSGELYVVEADSVKARRVANGSGETPPVTSFVEDGGKRMWVGTSRGLQLYDALSLAPLRRIAHDIRKPSGLAGNDVTTLLRDRAGWLWVGGLGLGLQRHNPENKAIALLAPDPDTRSVYRNPDIRSILQVDNGEVWASMQGDGVVVFDRTLRATGTVAFATQRIQPSHRQAGTAQGAKPLAALPQITSMVQRRDGRVWLGADSELMVVDSRHQLQQTIKAPIGPIRRLFESRDETLWIGTADGAYRLPRGVTQVVRLQQAEGDLTGEVHAFAQGPDGTIWAGTAAGLFTADPHTAVLKAVNSTPPNGLASAIVIGLLFDAEGTLWVDTGVAGLHRMTHWDGAVAEFDRVSHRHGLIGKPYGANLLADRQGRIWTQTGVYDPKADRLFELSAGDGADLGTGWFLSYAPTQDGRLLFGGSKGILVVSPDRFVETKFAAPLVVTDLRINGEHKDYGLPYRELVLEPSDRSFSIEFAALDFVNSSSLRYSYRLKGFADDWGATSANSRFASYSNLSPGTYTLQVRAANRSGDWSASELTIPVRKIAAWWQTTGFRLLGVAVALLLLFGLFRLRTKQLRVRQRELEAKVQERTEALELLNLELQQRSEALVQSSLIDPLTGLHNRRFLAQQIDADLALSQRALEAFGPAMAGPDWAGDLVFFLFDIDHFKRINDRHGHAVGDEVLIQFSQRIRAVFRDSDFLVRWGGEEFLGVARQTSRASAGELAERARMAIAGSAFEMQSGLSLRLTVSVGFAAYPLSIKHPRALMWEELVKLADAGLYLVKAHGRNGWAGVIDGGNLSADEIRDLVKRSLPEVLQLGQMGLECSAGVLAALNTARSEG